MLEFMDKFLEENLQEVFSKARLGFEKESLRVKDKKLAQTKHPDFLGSSLCNRFITTDFSESQLELITKPVTGNQSAIEMLENIHHFISSKLNDDELIWPHSMPPCNLDENEIQIAKFGSSYEGQFKHIYRKGLACRYGKIMQSISGFHFNYSLPDSVWSDIYRLKSEDIKSNRSEFYLNMIRNILEINWLIIYLFGASPIISKSLVKRNEDSFISLEDDLFLLPEATSLRMSEYGYSNTKRRLSISVNSLDEYISDLVQATKTIEPEYLKHEESNNSQLNANILQIEAEYYAVARAKSNLNIFSRPTSNLKESGIDFIEIRSLDLDPFSRIGIKKETVLFFELLMIFCCIKKSQRLEKRDLTEISFNDITVAKFGRKSKIHLSKKGDNVLLKDWGIEILEQMEQITDLMTDEKEDYLCVLRSMRSRINDPNKTTSGMLMKELKEQNMSFTELGVSLSKSYKDFYQSIKPSENPLWQELEEESKKSHLLQLEMESMDKASNMDLEIYKSQVNEVNR